MNWNLKRIVFKPSGARQRSRGMLGLATLHFDSFVVRFVAVRRSRTGRLVISFPKRQLRNGTSVTVFCPTDRAEHAEIERCVLAWLERHQGALR